jgi:hypothetical protein
VPHKLYREQPPQFLQRKPESDHILPIETLDHGRTLFLADKAVIAVTLKQQLLNLPCLQPVLNLFPIQGYRTTFNKYRPYFPTKFSLANDGLDWNVFLWSCEGMEWALD